MNVRPGGAQVKKKAMDLPNPADYSWTLFAVNKDFWQEEDSSMRNFQ